MTKRDPGLAFDRNQAGLTAINVSKRYRRNGRWVLRDVVLGIKTGGLTALVGPNGAGKSTLIRCWMGFEKPTSGEALVVGHDPRREPAIAMSFVGYVPQGSTFYRALTVEDHVQLGRSLRAGFDVAFVQARLRSLDIPLAQLARNLSGGQQAQMSLAIALGTRSPILILDEPLASLDPLARREFMGTLIDIARSGAATILLSSHVITDVEQASGRVILLSDGRVKMDLQVSDVLATHRVFPKGGVTSGKEIASFPLPDGSAASLAATTSPTLAGRAATLEEVVMGYLAADRIASTQELPASI